MNYILIFITGLTTGGLACLAVQGGLLASVIATQKGQQVAGTARVQNHALDANDWQPVAVFLITKLVAHTILGFLLGWLGSVMSLSLGVRLFFQAFTGLFMFATAMNLLQVHPLFRFVVLQPPKFIQRHVRQVSKSRHFFAPFILGIFTILIPCGVTQAMEVSAVNSGNPWVGAMILFAFVLGTTPLFAAVGIATARLTEQWYNRFTRMAAFALVLMALYAINGVLVVLNSPWTIQRVTRPVAWFFSEERFAVGAGISISEQGEQVVHIKVLNSGYKPRYFKVKQGIPVRLTISSDNTYSCAVAFVFPAFGIKTFLDPTDSETFVFTPQKKGTYTYTCSMGMYTGVMEVE